ncbi:MAG: excinuclease ABC subunit UvrA [Deltaproteobacteria bacterium]|nr:excinuclease ABC subunit UvrA [Deltaproteobacteria bacterium]
MLVQGAREHNLKNVDLTIPKKSLVVFTGVSGSGKSSMAFDTLYAEGQRRYVESLSSYARQFLGQMEKPRYDHIRGLAPTISIEQKTASKNPRSTVGTITEIYDYLRVLFARAGVQYCHSCEREVGRQSVDEMVERIMELPDGARFSVLAPVVRRRKGEYKELFRESMRDGFTRARVDGEVISLEEPPELKKQEKHDIALIVDRLKIRDGIRSRLTDSVETALRLADGLVIIELSEGDEQLYSERNYCAYCDLNFPELEPPLFSFNTPQGMCIACNGLGVRKALDPDRVVEDDGLSLKGGAIVPWAASMKRGRGWQYRFVKQATDALGIDREAPWRELPKKQRDILLYGSKKEITVKWQGKRSSGQWKTTIEGVIPSLERKHKQTESAQMRKYYESFMRTLPCPTCHGSRLRPEARSVKVGNASLPDIVGATIGDAHERVLNLGLEGNRAQIAEELIKEIRNRLGFLVNVGLEYLTLDRLGPTLSGGESQRIRLAAQVGTELTGVIYILDEPSIGLHQRDNKRLLNTLHHLRDIGNSVVVVEHDQETIEEADWVVDFGPRAGRLGGEIVFSGRPAQLLESDDSLTGKYLSGRMSIPTPGTRRTPQGWLEVRGASQNNLRDVDARFPVACLVAVTGVSGAGKSSLINGILSPALANYFHNATRAVGRHKEITGLDHFDKVIDIDQTPIGRTPRSNPATYTKVFDDIRTVFAGTKDARTAGFEKGRFSFNVKGGRCESCAGDGMNRIEMHFLADVFVPCEVCRGKRFNEATLRVKHKGLSISEVLNLSCAQALEHFSAYPKIRRVMQTLVDVGLGYIQLGQSSTTLSGGEAQRIKLSRELARRATGTTLYLLDEPTTGLHFDDVARLLEVLNRLVDQGNTVVVIEHNLDVVRNADYIVDVGPEGGAKGGLVVAEGTPEQVAAVEGSWTGHFLKEMVTPDPSSPPPRSKENPKPKPKAPAKKPRAKAKKPSKSKPAARA